MQDLERPFVAGDVELIARAALEGPAAVRPDLGVDAEGTQEAESATRDRRVGDVEMHRDLAAPSQMDTARRVEEA